MMSRGGHSHNLALILTPTTGITVWSWGYRQSQIVTLVHAITAVKVAHNPVFSRTELELT